MVVSSIQQVGYNEEDRTSETGWLRRSKGLQNPELVTCQYSAFPPNASTIPEMSQATQAQGDVQSSATSNTTGTESLIPQTHAASPPRLLIFISVLPAHTTWHLPTNKKKVHEFSVVGKQQIFKMRRKIFHICQTDLTSVNRNILRRDVSNKLSKVSRSLVARLEMPRMALGNEWEILMFSSGLSWTSCLSFVPLLHLKQKVTEEKTFRILFNPKDLLP